MHYILSIDKNKITGLELSGIIKSYPVKIINAGSMEEANNYINEKAYKFAIVIYTVGGEAGEIDEIRKLKSNMPRKTCLAVVSSGAKQENLLKAALSGVDEYFLRPFDEEAVRNKIVRLLGIKRRREEEDELLAFNFGQMINQELKAASRGDYPFSMIRVLLVEHDKRQAGKSDFASTIKLFSMILKKNLRDTDTVFRYNHNDFVMMLPFTDKGGCKNVSDKITEIFSTHSVIKERAKGYRLNTACVTFPQDGKTKDRLLEKLEKFE